MHLLTWIGFGLIGYVPNTYIHTWIGYVTNTLYNFFIDTTEIESALLELELLGVESSAAERAREALTSRLIALGAAVPVTLSKEKDMVRLKATLMGPKAVDVVYHIENLVSTNFFHQ
jgi:hypothetical protein